MAPAHWDAVAGVVGSTAYAVSIVNIGYRINGPSEDGGHVWYWWCEYTATPALPAWLFAHFSLHDGPRAQWFDFALLCFAGLCLLLLFYLFFSFLVVHCFSLAFLVICFGGRWHSVGR